MTSWMVFVAVGIGSHLLRVVPLVARHNSSMTPRLERGVHHGGIAALTALLVTSALSAGRGSTSWGVVLVAIGLGLMLALRGRSMLVVVAAGLVFAAAATLVAMMLTGVGGPS